jgi:hypothetical protein
VRSSGRSKIIAHKYDAIGLVAAREAMHAKSPTIYRGGADTVFEANVSHSSWCVRMKCKTLVVVSCIWATKLELKTNFASLHMTFSCFQHVKSCCENPIMRGRVANKRNYICRNPVNNYFRGSPKDRSN